MASTKRNKVTRKLSKALFYEQLYPHIFVANDDDKITLNNLTQRSEVGSICSNYNQYQTNISNSYAQNLNNNYSQKQRLS